MEGITRDLVPRARGQGSRTQIKLLMTFPLQLFKISKNRDYSTILGNILHWIIFSLCPITISCFYSLDPWGLSSHYASWGESDSIFSTNLQLDSLLYFLLHVKHNQFPFRYPLLQLPNHLQGSPLGHYFSHTQMFPFAMDRQDNHLIVC